MAHILRAMGILLLILEGSTRVIAQQDAFRVETQLLIEPLKQTLTLFSDGVSYDFALDDSTAITVIDPSRQRIRLLDPIRKIQTTLDMQELHRVVDNARAKAAQTELSDLLEAAKKSRYDEQTQTVIVGDELMSYRATLQKPRVEGMAVQYAQFADWSARLNAVYSPHLPPYLRLELNSLVAARGMLPREITRTIQHQGQESQIRSRLSANWRISMEDEKKIRRVGEMLVNFQEVSASEYFGAARQ